MTLSRNTILHHGASKTRNTLRLNKYAPPRPVSRLKSLLSCGFLVFILILMVSMSLDALDRNIYRGCTVLGQQGKVLTITLDEDISTGTGASCDQVARLVWEIVQDGFNVQITNHHWDKLGIIDANKAREMTYSQKGY